MKNIIADFTRKDCDTLRLKGLTQWDYGRVLEVKLENMPKEFEAHFSYQGFDDALVVEVTSENNVAMIPIPNLITTQNKEATCWIYYEDETCGATYKTILLLITPRTKPHDYVYTETEVFNYKIFKKEIESKIAEAGKVKTVNGTEPDENGNIEVGGKFVVTIAKNEEDKYVADKTFAEITEAHNAGKIVEAHLVENEYITRQMYLTNTASSVIAFETMSNGESISLSMLSTGMCMLSNFDTVKKPTVGKVGQFLAVNSVNSSSTEGEPMSFECVDPPQGFSGEWDDIKNKPFYSEETEKWFIDKREVTFDNSSHVSMRGLSDDFIELFNTVGSRLKVYWNGSIYECEVKYHDIAYYDYIDFADRRAYLEAGILTISNITAELETQTYEFGVFVLQETVKTLEEKFVPYAVKSEPQNLNVSQQMQARANLGLPYVRYEKEKIAFVAMVESGWNGEHSFKPHIYSDKDTTPYSVQMKVYDNGWQERNVIFNKVLEQQGDSIDVFDGVMFDILYWYGNLNLIKKHGDSTVINLINRYGFEENMYSDVPFVYYAYGIETGGSPSKDGYGVIFSDELTPSNDMFGYTIDIYDASSEGTPIYTPLEEEYIPKTYSWNDVQDKPFGELIDETIFSSGMTSGSSKKLNRPIKYAEYYIDINGWEYTVHAYPGDINEDYQHVLRVETKQDEGFRIYIVGDTISLYANEEGQYADINVAERNAIITKINEELIPNNIPKVQTAEVGQTLVVKAVDENGKPTEWECVNAGGMNQYKLSELSYITEIDGEKYADINFNSLPIGCYNIINDLDSISSVRIHDPILEDIMSTTSGEQVAFSLFERLSVSKLIHNNTITHIYIEALDKYLKLIVSESGVELSSLKKYTLS